MSVKLKIAVVDGYPGATITAEPFLPGLFIHRWFGDDSGREGYWQITHRSGRFLIGASERSTLESLRDQLSEVDWDLDPGDLPERAERLVNLLRFGS